MTGTKDNERMTEWRKNTSSQSPDGLKKQAEQFIRENPSSIISRWLLRKYFIVTAKPDLKKAKELVKVISGKTDKEPSIMRLAACCQKYSVSFVLSVFKKKTLRLCVFAFIF